MEGRQRDDPSNELRNGKDKMQAMFVVALENEKVLARLTEPTRPIVTQLARMVAKAVGVASRISACTTSKKASSSFSRTRTIGSRSKSASTRRILARCASATSTVLGDESDGSVGGTRGSRTFAKQLEYLFESTLFSCRFMVIAAVIGSVLMSLMLFTCGILEVWHTFKSVASSILREGRLAHTADLSLSSVEAMDMFLTGIVTFIFGTGVYELFVSDIDVAGEYKSASGKDEKPGWMSVSGIDDLEVRLGKVVITVLIVQIMAVAKSLHVTTPLHMVYMGIAFFLAAAGLSLLTWVEKSHK